MTPSANARTQNLILAHSDKRVAHSKIPDAILIDDDELVRMNWKMAAKRKNRILRVYACPEEFWKDSEALDRATPIYVDSNLGNGAKGEDVTWLMGKKGYGNLFLATGTNADQFDAMPWVKGIVGKGPPWTES